MLWWMRQWRKKMVESNEERKKTGQRLKEWRIPQCVGEQKVREGERYQERRYGLRELCETRGGVKNNCNFATKSCYFQ